MTSYQYSNCLREPRNLVLDVRTGERHAQLTFVARIYSKHELVFSDFLALSLSLELTPAALALTVSCCGALPPSLGT